MSRFSQSGSDLRRFTLGPAFPADRFPCRPASVPPRRLWPALVAVPLLLASGYAGAQQSQYPQYPQPPQYGYGYGSQSPQPGYAPPQYAQPQYPQPPYAQPQYGPQPQYGQQPQYSQEPQYGQQQPYAAPGEAYAGQPDAGQAYAEPPQSTQPPLSPDRLEQLVAPIALYPDALLAQILTASTYPAQIAVADQWLQQMQAQGYGAPEQVAAGADSQPWDPSVKALTAVPQVLAMLDHNLQWTTELGDAYFNQPQDLMQTVQVLRQRAQSAGNLESTPQETVSDEQGAIELAPPSPEVAYVPSYNPWLAYGAPIAPYPGFSFAGALGSFFGTGLRFGAGIAMNAFDQTPFGWMGWTLSWLAHAVFFHHSTYFTHSATVADWGFPRGGPRAYGGGWGRGGYGHDARPGYGEAARYGEYARSNYARDGAVARAPQNYGYARENGYDRGGVYIRGNALASNRGYDREGQFNRGYASRAYNDGRGAPQQAYGRPTPAFSHPQTYGGIYGAYGRSGYGYAGRQGHATGGRAYTSPAYRFPQSSYQRAYAEAPSRSFVQPGRSGGFFGHGRKNEDFGGHQARVFSGGHSARGFKAFRGGGEHFKMPRSRGGGHRHR